jgi:hypothetical protein
MNSELVVFVGNWWTSIKFTLLRKSTHFVLAKYSSNFRTHFLELKKLHHGSLSGSPQAPLWSLPSLYGCMAHEGEVILGEEEEGFLLQGCMVMRRIRQFRREQKMNHARITA